MCHNEISLCIIVVSLYHLLKLLSFIFGVLNHWLYCIFNRSNQNQAFTMRLVSDLMNQGGIELNEINILLKNKNEFYGKL